MKADAFKAMVMDRVAEIGLGTTTDAAIVRYMNLGEQAIIPERPEAFYREEVSIARTDYVVDDLADATKNLNIIAQYEQALCNYVCAYLVMDDTAYTDTDGKAMQMLSLFSRDVGARQSGMQQPQQGQ